MKKLLLLLPLALVTSCSAGHDLKSDKPFVMSCPAMYLDYYEFKWGVVEANPQTKRGTVRRLFDREKRKEDSLTITSSDSEFILDSGKKDYLRIRINRLTGKVEFLDENDDTHKIEGCRFETPGASLIDLPFFS